MKPKEIKDRLKLIKQRLESVEYEANYHCTNETEEAKCLAQGACEAANDLVDLLTIVFEKK